MAARHDIDKHIKDSQIKKESLLTVYAVVSQEPVLLSAAVASLRSLALTQAPDFNRDELRAGDIPMTRVVEAASTMPMMAAQRWVHLCDIQRLKAAEHEPLLTYLNSPSPTTVLCLSGEKLDLRTKLGQKLNKMGALFVLEAPKAQALAGWLQRRAKSRGYSIAWDAAQLLADLIGADLGTLDMALEKLATYVGDADAISADDVETIVAPTRVHSIFNLTDAIGERHIGKASVLLRNALGGGESALMVLAMVSRQFRHLLQAKELAKSGDSNARIAQAIGVRPFLVDALIRQARQYTTAELYTALSAAASADIRLKSSGLAPGIILDRLLVDVMAAGEKHP